MPEHLGNTQQEGLSLEGMKAGGPGEWLQLERSRYKTQNFAQIKSKKGGSSTNKELSS